MDLTKQHCVPCEGGVPRLSRNQSKIFLKKLKSWKLSGNKILKNYKFRDFKAVMKFVNLVSKVAEAEGHHPDILIYSWNKLKLTIYTHAIKGLSENDFILAAKIDSIRK